ncbi:MBL fold metallo-hydrolase [Larkinella soli]|uniref:MBL fold metallo-hydrolase n=1 Tax=Larkinella soli TaxID=1770527 RepID=UPI0019D15E29|nr:MBL fold metallo-hydrolase [Larkinella soli]
MRKAFKIMALVTLSLLALIALGTVAFVNLAPQFGAAATGERLKRMQASPNFKDGTFQNLVPTSLDLSFLEGAKAAWQMLRGTDDSEPKATIQTVPLDVKRLEGAGDPDHVAVAWFGHSSLLIRMGGKTFLTDPVLVGERVSMVSMVGPKRFPYDHYIGLDELPKVDAVLMSHDHYDHLDYPTFVRLKERAERFFVPLGVGAHLEKWGIPADRITELDWDESVQFGTLTLVCAPSRHFSGRGLTNRNSTLWCSWVLKGENRRVYFGGDSGYYPGFKTIGEKYGPFDLALLECGAYNEKWIDIHMLPEQTAQAQLDVRAEVLMPIHWAKFNLALHPWRDPIRRLTQRAAQLGSRLATPRIGEVLVLGEPVPTAPWWESIP